MHEKTLLFGALAATAIAAGFGVYKARETPPPLAITPVAKLDSTRIVHSTDVPVRLTASDGTGLRLASIHASAAIEDPLALTELHLVFENAEDRVLEGTFSIALPRGASVSRFAMKIGDAWREGEVVEKQQARAAYEDFLHRRQDPALLEQAAGNEFSARVFPIPARGKKELVIAYSETLEAGAPYVLPLQELPALSSIDIDVRGGGSSAREATFGLHQRSFAPAEDFVVAASALPRSPGLRSGELVLARVIPFATSRPEPIESAVVLVDTSASRALGLVEQADLVRRVLSKLRPDARVSVGCFDQEVVPIYDGVAGGFGNKEVSAIVRRGALGTSDFQQAISWAGTEASRLGLRRIVVVGDGVATAGETDTQQLRLEVEKLRKTKVERIDAIAVGGIRDEAFLRSLVRGVLDKDGVVLDGAIGADGLARRLSEATFSGIAVNVEGATWSWPRTLDGLQAGDEVIVHAEVPASAPVRIDVGGQQFTPDLRAAPRPLVERSWAQAKIQSLLETPSADPTTTKNEIVALGTRHRIVSPHTSLLVLETDADYERFGIDRKANRNILSVRDGRIAVLQGPAVSAPSSPSTDASVRNEPVATRATKDEEEGEEKARAKQDTAPVQRPMEPPPPPSVQAAPSAGYVESPSVPDLSTSAPSKEATGGKVMPPTATATATTRPTPRPVPTPTPAPPKVEAKNERADVPAPKTPAPEAKPTPRPAKPKSRGTNNDDETTKALEALQNAAQLEADRDGVDDVPQPTTIHTIPPVPDVAESPPTAAPYEGRFEIVMALLARGDRKAALDEAARWHAEQPGDVMALVALGEALEANGDIRGAARAYGSIAELYPSRADLRRFAGERLERLADPAALLGAIDTYAKAVAARPDHPSSHRLYAFALLKHGEHEKAFSALRAATLRVYPPGRFLGVDRVLREDLGLVAAAWTRAQPHRAREIRDKLRASGGVEETEPSLRFVLFWETDANDVDFHIYDARGGHAFYSQKELASGGSLYADVTTGYGPECFTIRAARERRSYPYRLQANYYSRGPMGYGMGKLELIDHDGRGSLVFDERPFVVMADHAFVDLGTVDRVPVGSPAMK